MNQESIIKININLSDIGCCCCCIESCSNPPEVSPCIVAIRESWS